MVDILIANAVSWILEFLHELLSLIECMFKANLWESGFFEGFLWKNGVERA